MMEQNRLAEICRASIDPVKREAAEKELETVKKIIGFAPSLLSMVLNGAIDMPTRQAGAVFLKNLIVSSWADPPEPDSPAQPLEFSVHEQDRAMLRDSIVDAVIQSPPQIRSQMAVCLIQVIKHDFPHRWIGIVDKVVVYLETPNNNESWLGALLALYQLVKNYEYKNKEDRAPLLQAMKLILPILQELTMKALPDESEPAVLVQKQCLKVFHALVQFSLPLELLSQDVFGRWMEICRVVIQRPVPASTLEVVEEERPGLIHWKCKKWALHIVTRCCERYGLPNSVSKEYKQFAEFYIKSFAQGIIATLFQSVLDPYRQGQYVSYRVLQESLQYLVHTVGQALCWKFIKPHINVIIQQVIFKILCFNDEDEEMWRSDPTEYIRVKFDLFAEYQSPVTAAQNLLDTVCKKRKNVLQKTMEWVTGLINSGSLTPRQQDGAFNMVGAVSSTLLRKKPYKTQLEGMLCSYVFPLFLSNEGYLRARGCWLLQQFSEAKFTRKENLIGCVDLLRTAIMNPQEEVPVKVQAAVAIQELMSDQEEIKNYLEPHIRDLTLCLLDLIRSTEIDEVTSCVQRIVCNYSAQLMPVAIDITNHLAQSFTAMLTQTQEDGDDTDSRAMAAMGILSTLETILAVWDESKEVIAQLEPIILQIVSGILTQGVSEFYEEAFSLVYSLCCDRVSANMWHIFSIMYEAFERDAHEFFIDMMPVLHALITVDTPTFLSNENHVVAMYSMAKYILEKAGDEGPMCHSAKLLEVIILHCGNSIEKCIPAFLEICLQRLFKKIESAELRQMLLQVLISAMYVNRQLTLSTLERHTTPPLKETNNQTIPVLDYFVKRWIEDVDCFLGVHDRKMCVLGMCCLMDPGWSSKPAALEQILPRIMPSFLMLFDGLKRAYAYRATLEGEQSDDEEAEEGSDIDDKQLSSDEDDLDDDGQAYIEQLAGKMRLAGYATIHAGGGDGVDDDESIDDEEQTALECQYSTPLDADEGNQGYVDEFAVFNGLLEALQSASPAVYNQMINILNDEQKKELHNIVVYANQRKAAAESAQIKRQGGYQFNANAVPQSFNFGARNGTFAP
ncbi:importin-7-like [Tropilaelaps mercedesae]|uniref:Importin-7-like n=1 Tax=Tropilaelaps mercedesae TaxID=418985 RepID=A0A1V9X4V0_9ACAR|nr:importin-7-like [Tropilaelaps mercedesae]